LYRFVNFEIANEQDDMENGFDMVFKIDSVQCAVRLRRDNVNFRDLTVRYSVPSGAKTEYAKLKEGKGDLYFYGWTNDTHISEFILVNIHKLRETSLLDNYKPIANTDGTKFIAIPLVDLKNADCILEHRKLGFSHYVVT